MAQQRKDFETTEAWQQEQIDVLPASLQRMSAQLAAASPSDGGLKLSKAETKTVLNNH